jgi:tRNA threonylcarbamoyl adenosine modification protein (Sua5/YciO/YrdC/YwlC family)
MAQYFLVHPDNPQRRLIAQAAEIVRHSGLIVYPTDSCYALGCQIGDKTAQERIRAIRQVDERHHFTLVCRDLSEIAHYARVDNAAYRLLRATTPGSYTFILRASAELPRRLQNPKRRTIGLRVPEHRVAQALLGELREPLLSSTLILPGDDLPLNDAVEIRARLEHQVDLVMDAGSCGLQMTTVVDLTSDMPEIVRLGKGRPEPFGIATAIEE